MSTDYTTKEPTKTGWGSLPWGSVNDDKEYIRGWGGVKTQYSEYTND